MSDDEMLIRWTVRKNIPAEQWAKMTPEAQLVLLKLFIRDILRRRVRAQLLARVEYGNGYQIAARAWIKIPTGPPKKSVAATTKAMKAAA